VIYAVDPILIMGPVFAGLSGLMLAVAAFLTRGDKVKETKSDMESRLVASMQTHLNFMSDENRSYREEVSSLRRRVREVEGELATAELDKMRMKSEFERRIAALELKEERRDEGN